MQSCSMAAQENGSELQEEFDKGIFSHQYSFNIFLERIMCEALDGHERSVSIGGRLITNFRFADDIMVNVEEEEEAGVLVDRLDRTTTKYKMEIGPDKTKVMTNNPNGFQREIKIKGQRLEVENFKYLGAIVSNEGSKPEILSRISQKTAALSRLKIIWRDNNISLASKVKLMRSSSYHLPLFLRVDLDSRNLEKDPSP